MAKSKVYVEPEGYFPKDIRKKCGLGEYAKAKPKEAGAKKNVSLNSKNKGLNKAIK